MDDRCASCPHWSATEGCTWVGSAFCGVHVDGGHMRCLSWWLECVELAERAVAHG